MAATRSPHRIAAQRAYAEAGIRDPRKEIDLIEVHDCFSITELVLMEDLGLSDEGSAPHDIRDGRYDRDGTIPCQIDGGLKCFGHPIGATGLRMAYEIYLQLLGRAGERQLAEPVASGSHTTSAAFRTATSRALRFSGCTSPDIGDTPMSQTLLTQIPRDRLDAQWQPAWDMLNKLTGSATFVEVFAQRARRCSTS